MHACPASDCQNDLEPLGSRWLIDLDVAHGRQAGHLDAKALLVQLSKCGVHGTQTLWVVVWGCMEAEGDAKSW